MNHFSLYVQLGWVFIITGLAGITPALGKEKSSRITLLHTNDLHSHFRPIHEPLSLGGVARLRTLVTRLKKRNPHALLLDAGDWSEGSIYYNDGAGLQSLSMMEHIGYDVITIGNHDWLNGPDTLLENYEKVQPHFATVSANLDFSDYEKGVALQKWVSPYVVRQVEGLKVAFIGLATFEFIYDRYFAPVKIREPFLSTAALSTQLKEENGVDVVVVISHNSTSANEKILQSAPAVDLIISGHDHKKYTQPFRVNRSNGNPGWIVETGEWGRCLGQVTLEINSQGVTLVPDQSYLIQMDSSIPEDPLTLARIKKIEDNLQVRYGRLFDTTIAENPMEYTRTGLENSLGNLVTDVYLSVTQADFAIDSSRFMSGELSEGPIRLADVYNAISQIYDPRQNKNWTIQTIPLSGRALKWLLYAYFVSKKLSAYGTLSVSGLSFTYDPFFLQSELQMRMSPDIEASSVGLIGPSLLPNVKDIRVQGQPIDLNHHYRVALGNGIVEGIRFVRDKIWDIISLDDLQDTGIESWRALASYISSNTQTISDMRRMRPLMASPGVRYQDLQWTPMRKTSTGMLARVKVKVTNFGIKDYDAEEDHATVHLLVNKNSGNITIEPEFQEIGFTQSIPSLRSGEFKEINWEVEIPKISGLYPVTARLEGVEAKIDHHDDEVTRWFRLK